MVQKQAWSIKNYRYVCDVSAVMNGADKLWYSLPVLVKNTAAQRVVVEVGGVNG
jgi:hypothetical protein